MNLRAIKYLSSTFCRMLCRPQSSCKYELCLLMTYLWSSGEIRLRFHLGKGKLVLRTSPSKLASPRGRAILNRSCSSACFHLCSALYLSMKDTEKGVKELNLEKDKKIFNHCFTGKRSCGSDVGLPGWAIWRSCLALSVCGGMWSEVGGLVSWNTDRWTWSLDHWIFLSSMEREKGRPILCGSR